LRRPFCGSSGAILCIAVRFTTIVTIVLVALAASGNARCSQRKTDRLRGEVTYHEAGSRLIVPEFEVTVSASGIVRVRCLQHCAPARELIERIPVDRAQAVFEALDQGGFFRMPRVDVSAPQREHAGLNTVTYRDEKSIHEVTDAERRLPAIVAAIRAAFDVTKVITPADSLPETTPSAPKSPVPVR
jgi:hypothetical protein